MKKISLLTLLILLPLVAGQAVQNRKAAAAPGKAPSAAPSPAASASPASADGSATAAATPAPIELKNKSSFSFETNSRNPFWQIGWKPAAKLADPGTSDHGGSDISASAFMVTSITLGKTDRFAIINGKIMQEGQQFGLQMGGQTYQISVKSIQDGRVVFGRRDQEIVVPLRRK